MKAFLALIVVLRTLSPAGPPGTGTPAVSLRDSLNPGGTAVHAVERDPYPRGISTTFGRTFYRSSFTNYASPDYDFYVGFGYNITPSYLVGIKIYTGGEDVGGRGTAQLAGKLAFGGGALEVTHRFLHEGTFRPLATVGYELITVLLSQPNSGLNSNGYGYNGRGLNLQAGVEYYPASVVSIESDIVYQYRVYGDAIVNGDFQSLPGRVIDRVIGFNLSCFVHFNIVP